MDPLFPPDPPQQHPHLELRRAEPTMPRRKPRPPGPPTRDNRSHGLAISAVVENAVAEVKVTPRPMGVDPALILRIRTSQSIDEDEWRRAGLVVVGSDPGKVLLLFASDAELSTFRERVDAYRSDFDPSRKNPPYNGLIAAIEPDGISSLGPEDRIGPLLEQLIASGGPDPEVEYRLDIELWDFGTRELCDEKLNELRRFVEERGGALTDELVRDGLVLARIRLPGGQIQELLTIPTIATADLPPRAGYSIAEVLQRALDEVPPVRPPAPDAPRICVIDGGIARGHPLLKDAIGETIATPRALGDGLDVNGHGTTVAAVALYGDVDAAWRAGDFSQEFWIDGARVTNERNEFDDDRLIPSQMIDAIEYFAGLGCRVFNISLGDKRLPFQDGGRPSAWADTLDNLAHRLGVLIVVSAGNYDHHLRDDVDPSDCLNNYPHYLLNDEARIIEPATAANALTVGALAGTGEPRQSQRYPNDIPPRPIAAPLQPAPFTRSGFGVGGSVKPELVELGGNYSYDPHHDRVEKDVGLAIVSLNWQYEQGRLFILDRGTSLAAPRVANLAARVFAEFPDASSNLVRALLIHGAKLPEAIECLPLTDEECQRICGYGLPDISRVLYSTDQRTVLVAENSLPLDWMHFYEVPIPEAFRNAPGKRRIAITLAFDPPVRRRRMDYLGNSMNFRLVRGLILDQVVDAFRAVDPSEDPISLHNRSKCPLEPVSTRRERGTIQHADWVIQRNRSLDYDEPYYLVIRSKRGWQSAAGEEQPYAVAVSLEGV